jgi:hypothetical protein
MLLPNTRMQRTRSSASPPHSPLMRCPLGRTGIFGTLFLATACASNTGSHGSRPGPAIEYCALVDGGTAFTGQTVRVRATFSVDYEHSVLSGKGCKALTWVQFDPSWSTNTQEDVRRAVWGSADGSGGSFISRSVTVVVVGSLTGSGQPEFGHLMCCGYSFNLEAVESAAPADE